MSNDNILRMALNNLPSGRTGLSNTNANETEHWEPKENGTFELKTYRTIEQTEIIAGNLKKRNYNILILVSFRIGN